MEPVREQILNLQHISYTYHTLQGETLALSDISFSLKKGEFAAIVGPSGCGKSTLLSLICGLLPCTEGQIKINGKPLKESTTNVGYMLQHDELFEWRTIYNNVILGLEVQHALTARTKQRAHELLDIYGLGDFKNARPSELSGGMRQRAALIRTLVLEPELLLLDEPFPPWTIRPGFRLAMTSVRSSGMKENLHFWSRTTCRKRSHLPTVSLSFLIVRQQSNKRFLCCSIWSTILR